MVFRWYLMEVYLCSGKMVDLVVVWWLRSGEWGCILVVFRGFLDLYRCGERLLERVFTETMIEVIFCGLWWFFLGGGEGRCGDFENWVEFFWEMSKRCEFRNLILWLLKITSTFFCSMYYIINVKQPRLSKIPVLLGKCTFYR